ncbi:MAG: hypothetical protein ACI4B3_10450 [Prevotella sp.]
MTTNNMEGNNIKKVFDERGAMRCVLFDSGNAGVVNAQGEKVLELGPCEWLKFGVHGFLKGYCGREFFIDMMNGEPYSSMPEIMDIGGFELTYIGGYICTRTKKLYEFKGIPEMVYMGKKGLYLTLPVDREPEENIREKMIAIERSYYVCLLNGDDSGVYWRIEGFEDGTLVVMTDDGSYYHVTRNARTGKAEKHSLGRVANEADKAMMVQTMRNMDEQVADNLKKEAAKAKKIAEKEREKQIATLVSAEPFRIGSKWGLRKEGRIVVPPIYRNLKSPVGKYCAVEKYPGIWGVIAVDGKVEIEPRYEGVKIRPDGTVELTVFNGKTMIKKLKN